MSEACLRAEEQPRLSANAGARRGPGGFFPYSESAKREQPCDTLVLDSWPPDLGGNGFLLL